MVTLGKKHSSQTTYRDAGVDIRSADEFVRAISSIADGTISRRPGPLEGLGGFGALFDIQKTGYKDPILVSSTDGVGTKLRIAIDTNNVETIGIDLVAMCVNDVLVHGAEPLFFLDYLALGKLDQALGVRILEGIAEGCKMAGAALVGGETAEMPGFYQEGDFDLAGFTVGIVERQEVLPRRREINPSDILVGIASSGAHSNGYSFIRRVVKDQGLRWSDQAPFCREITLGEAFLRPTRIYVKSILNTLRNTDGIKALAHITGSGALGKLHRILPPPSEFGVKACINLESWRVPSMFRWLRDSANLPTTMDGQKELLRVFNCGVGMVAVVSPNNLDAVLKSLKQSGEQAFRIGEIVSHSEPSGAWADFEDAVDLKGQLIFEEYGDDLKRRAV